MANFALTFKCNLCKAGDWIEKSENVSLYWDVLCTEGGIQEAVTARVRAGWKIFKDVADVLCKKGLSVKLRGLEYKIYIKSAMSYEAEC